MADTSGTSKSLPVAGRATATSGAAVPLVPNDRESYRAIREILLQADPTNTDNVSVGNKDAQGLVLQPGESLAIPIENPHEVWIVAASGTQHVGFLGRD